MKNYYYKYLTVRIGYKLKDSNLSFTKPFAAHLAKKKGSYIVYVLRPIRKYRNGKRIRVTKR